MTKPKDIPQKVLDALSYDPDTGIFRWVVDPTSWISAGAIAGTKTPTGHIVIKYSGKNYPASRIAWKKVYGYDPRLEVDHINRNQLDNRICNLRLASGSQNNQNKTTRIDNTSGFPGVSFVRHIRKWKAKINIDGRYHNLGYYKTREAAYKIYKEASLKLHGEFSPFHNPTRE